jgi:hypothetical protein
MTGPEALLHRVEWRDGQPKFYCYGDRSAPCHFFPDCECERRTEEHKLQHPDVEHDDECWLLPWLENVDVECTWARGNGVDAPPRRDGYIAAWWESDCESVIWDYADSTVPS